MAQIVLPSLCNRALSVGVEHSSTLVEAANASAGEVDDEDRTLQIDEIANDPVDGAGMGIGRRGRSVGPRCTFIVGIGIVVDVEGREGTME